MWLWQNDLQSSGNILGLCFSIQTRYLSSIFGIEGGVVDISAFSDLLSTFSSLFGVELASKICLIWYKSFLNFLVILLLSFLVHPLIISSCSFLKLELTNCFTYLEKCSLILFSMLVNISVARYINVWAKFLALILSP